MFQSHLVHCCWWILKKDTPDLLLAFLEDIQITYAFMNHISLPFLCITLFHCSFLLVEDDVRRPPRGVFWVMLPTLHNITRHTSSRARTWYIERTLKWNGIAKAIDAVEEVIVELKGQSPDSGSEDEVKFKKSVSEDG